MNIQKFTENDRRALKEIYYASRKKAFYWMDTSTFTPDDFDRDTKDEIIWVAHLNHKPVGFVSIWEQDNFIHSLYVHPESVGQGIGTELLDVCLREIGRPVTLKCSEPNINARGFYLSKGWDTISTGENEDGRYLLMRIDNHRFIVD